MPKKEGLQVLSILAPKGGFIPSTLSLKEDAFYDVLNFHVTADGLALAQGYKQTGTLSLAEKEEVRSTTTVYDKNHTPFMLVFTNKRILQWDGTSFHDRTPVEFTGFAGIPQVATFEGKVYVCDTATPLLVWDFLASTFTVTTNTPKAAAIGVLGNRLIVGNVITGTDKIPYRIQWSNPLAPLEWEEENYLELPTMDSIFALAPIKEFLAIYTTSTIYLLRYLGTLPIFALIPTNSNVFVVSPKTIVPIVSELVLGHFVATQNGAWLYDGVNFRLVSANIMDYWQDYITTAAPSNLWCFYNPRTFEVWVRNSTYPFCLVYNLMYEAWTKIERPAHGLGYGIPFAALKWEDITQPLNQVNFAFDDAGIRGEENQLLGIEQRGQNLIGFIVETGFLKPDNKPMEAFVISPFYDFGVAGQSKLVWSHHVRWWTTSPSLTARLTYSAIAKQTWTQRHTLAIPGVDIRSYAFLLRNSPDEFNLQMKGRYFRFHIFIRSDTPFKLQGWQIFWEPVEEWGGGV